MPELRQVLPVLKVASMARTVAFYTGHLGFTERWRETGDDGAETCLLAAGEVRLLFSTGSYLGGRPAFTGTLYFETAGVDALYEAVRTAVPIAWPLEDMDYGQREFGVRDPDGYLLAFAEPAE